MDDLQPTATETFQPRRGQRQAYAHMLVQRRDEMSYVTVSVDWHRHPEPTESAVHIAVEHESRHPLLIRVTTGRASYQPITLGSSRQNNRLRFEFMMNSDWHDEVQGHTSDQLPNMRFVLRRFNSITGHTQTGLDVVLDVLNGRRPRQQSPGLRRQRDPDSQDRLVVESTETTLSERFTAQAQQAFDDLSASRSPHGSIAPSDISRAASASPLWSSIADIEPRDSRSDTEQQ